MLIVTATIVAALVLVLSVVLSLRCEYSRQGLGWQLLAHAGWPLVLAGAIFVARFWHPTREPYLANVRYPYGSHLDAWAVSFGFTWVAFGLLFAGVAVLAPAAQPRRAWVVLFAAWVLCWLPHGYIGIATALGGLDSAGSAHAYQDWAHRSWGELTLLGDAVLLLLHFVLSGVGFYIAGRDAWHRSDVAPLPMQPPIAAA
ncbi:MAG: hypothetical protein ACR2MQ_02255 [Gemmatimonadaceae bacterium]